MSERVIPFPEVLPEEIMPVTVVAAAVYFDRTAAGVVKAFLFEDGLLIFPNPRLQTRRPDNSNAWQRKRYDPDEIRRFTEVIAETELPSKLYEGVAGDHPVIDMTTKFPGSDREQEERFYQVKQSLERRIDRRVYWELSQWPPSADAEAEILDELDL